MFDVATQAGVSKATVSRVLNNNENVSKKIKARVLSACETLNYKLNSNIQDFILKARSNTTRNIAFVMVKKNFADPAYSYLIDGISTEINKRHYHMILAKLSGEEKTLYDLPPILRDERVDGIILSGSFGPNIVKIIKNLTTQCVVIGNYDTHLLNSLSNVRFNYQLSILNVINTFVAQGKKRIAFVDEMQGNFLVQKIFNTYKVALTENNLPFNKDICYFGQGPFSGIYQTLQPVFNSNTLPFDAILCPTLRLAQEISNLIMAHFGFNQKIDIIIATSRPSDYYKLSVPTIYIENSYATIAQAAIKLLIEQIEENAVSQTIIIN